MPFINSFRYKDGHEVFKFDTLMILWCVWIVETKGKATSALKTCRSYKEDGTGKTSNSYPFSSAYKSEHLRLEHAYDLTVFVSDLS